MTWHRRPGQGTPDIDIHGKIQKMSGEGLTDFKALGDELDPTQTLLCEWTGKIFPAQS